MTTDYKTFEAFVPQRNIEVQDKLNNYTLEVNDSIDNTNAEFTAFQKKADVNFNNIKSQVSLINLHNIYYMFN